jgi:hypothetical protein
MIRYSPAYRCLLSSSAKVLDQRPSTVFSKVIYDPYLDSAVAELEELPLISRTADSVLFILFT